MGISKTFVSYLECFTRLNISTFVKFSVKGENAKRNAKLSTCWFRAKESLLYANTESFSMLPNKTFAIEKQKFYFVLFQDSFISLF